MQRPGIARPVGDEDPVGLAVEDRLGGRGAGHDRHLAAEIDQVAEDVPLHAEIEGDDVRTRGRAARRKPRVRRAGASAVDREPTEYVRSSPSSHERRLPRHDLASQVAADQARAGLGLGHQARVVEVGRGEDSLHRPPLARQPDQGAGVDPLDADDAVFLEIGRQRAVRADNC